MIWRIAFGLCAAGAAAASMLLLRSSIGLWIWTGRGRGETVDRTRSQERGQKSVLESKLELIGVTYSL